MLFQGKRTRGRQVYLGGYLTEEEAAIAYDKAAIAFLGATADINVCSSRHRYIQVTVAVRVFSHLCVQFPFTNYQDFILETQERSPDEIVVELRRGSVGFARGRSQYRGVTKHHQQGKWEARIGRLAGNKYSYLGTFDSPEEAARAYDAAAVKFKGKKAMTNFPISNYIDILEDPDSFEVSLNAACVQERNGKRKRVEQDVMHSQDPFDCLATFLPYQSDTATGTPPQHVSIDRYTGHRVPGKYDYKSPCHATNEQLWPEEKLKLSPGEEAILECFHQNPNLWNPLRPEYDLPPLHTDHGAMGPGGVGQSFIDYMMNNDTMQERHHPQVQTYLAHSAVPQNYDFRHHHAAITTGSCQPVSIETDAVNGTSKYPQQPMRSHVPQYSRLGDNGMDMVDFVSNQAILMSNSRGSTAPPLAYSNHRTENI